MSFGPLSGPFPVGFRDESLPSGVNFRLFYPTSHRSVGTCSWIMSPQYLITLVRFGLGRSVSSFLGPLIHWVLRYPHLEIQEAGTPSAREGPFPLVLLSHGLGGQRMSYSKLASHIASQGFVVAAPEHLDGSASLAFKDPPGEWVEYMAPSGDIDENYTLRNAQIITRKRELREVQNALMSNSHDDTSFIDRGKTLLCGHSFGALTIMTLLHDFPQEYAGGVAYDIFIDPLAQRPDIMEKVPQLGNKLLFLNNEFFIKKVKQDLMGQLDPDSQHNNVWTIKGTLHYCQSDIPTVVRNARILPYFLSGKFDFEKDEQGFALSVDAFVSYVKSNLFKEGGSLSFEELMTKNKEDVFQGF